MRATCPTSSSPTRSTRRSGIFSNIAYSRRMRQMAVVMAILAALAVTRAQESSEARRKPLDFILDNYVRDGEVYYRALKTDRGRLDTYLGAIASVAADKLDRDE